MAVALALSGHSAFGMTLPDAYEIALQNDPVYQSAMHQMEAGRKNRQIGWSALLPVVSASHSGTWNRAHITAPDFRGQPDTNERFYSSTVSTLQLRQPLFNPEATARYRQGQAQAELSESVFSAAGHELLLRLVGAYFDAQLAETRLVLATVQRDTFAEQVRMNERMFRGGEGTRTDMLETQARYDLALAQVLEAQEFVADAHAALAAIVGREVTSLSRLDEHSHGLPADAETFETWKALALEHNPDIAALRHAATVAQEEINRARSGHLPRLDAVISVSRASSETLALLNQESTVRAAGLQLTIPLYAGGLVSATTSQAISNHARAKSDLEARIRQVLLDLHKQHNLLQSRAVRIGALKKSVESARLAVAATEQSIRGGVRINLDLLIARQQLYTAQSELAVARFGHLLGYLRLRSAAGTLRAVDLRIVAAQFIAP